MEKNKISISQMCEELGVTRGTIYNKIKENNFTLEKIGKQSYLNIEDFKKMKGERVDESPICNVMQANELTPSKIDNYYSNKISDLRFELQKEHQENQKLTSQLKQEQIKCYDLSNEILDWQQRYEQLEIEYKKALELLQIYNFIGNYGKTHNNNTQNNMY